MSEAWKLREDFEAAYLKQFKRSPAGWNESVERYTDAHAAGAWWAWRSATPKAFGDGWCAAKALEMDEDRIDRIAASHGDGEHYGEVGG